MAADLPDMHRSPEAMARCLATYISDPERIRSEVKVAFGSSPCAYTIKEMRGRHLRSLEAKGEAYDPSEGYWPETIRKEADRTNRDFLAKLQAAYPERFAA